MKLLLDTCTFLWVVLEPAKLSPRCVDLFTDPANSCFLSAVSAWEIAVKHGLGQIVLRQPPHVFVPSARATASSRGLFTKPRRFAFPRCRACIAIPLIGC